MPLKKDQKDEMKKCLLDFFTDKEFMSLLADKITEIVEKTLDKRLGEMDSRIEELENRTEQYQSKYCELEKKVDMLEQANKLKKLRLYGMVEEPKEKLKDKVLDIISKKMGIPEINLEDCYRIGKKNAIDKNPRPVILLFDSTKFRNKVFHTKKLLKGSGLVIVEELSRINSDIFRQAKERFGVKKVWSRDGRIFVNLNGKIHMIGSTEEIKTLK